MTEHDRGALLQNLTNGIFFPPTRHLTKDALRSIVFETDFSDSDLDALNSIEVLAPASEELAVIMPARSVPCVWLSEALETEPPEVAKKKIAWALASAVALAKGLGPDQVVNDARDTMRRWGFPAPEGAAA